MKRKAIVTLEDGTQILAAGETSGRAVTNLRAVIPTQTPDTSTKAAMAAAASLWRETPVHVNDNVPVPPQQERPPLTDDRYISVEFRALSQVFLANRGLDFSTPGVLEAAVPLLAGKTVYPNHDFRDIYNWLGVVKESFWDAAGAKSGGVPGINAQIKVDAFLNYRIACGLMMDPPAVNSMSLTVCFEFEYSHPQMERWRFWELLGEEVDGEVVRLIVTKIVEFWEASLVSVPEDRIARHQGHDPETDDEDDSDDDSLSAADNPANSTQEKTMKLTTELKSKLGIEFDGEDVPETEILAAAERLAANQTPADVAELQSKAKLADQMLDDRRKEVVRLATIAELGSAEGELDSVVAETIADASVERLQSLHGYYERKAAEKLPAGRTSKEGEEAVENAAGVTSNTAGLKPVGLF